MWLSAMCAFAIIGCTWAFAAGRYGGPDEPAHIIRAAAVAQGDLLGNRSPDSSRAIGRSPVAGPTRVGRSFVLPTRRDDSRVVRGDHSR